MDPIWYKPEELAVPVHHYSVTLAAFTLMFHPLLVESRRQWSKCCLTDLLLVQLWRFFPDNREFELRNSDTDFMDDEHQLQTLVVQQFDTEGWGPVCRQAESGGPERCWTSYTTTNFKSVTNHWWNRTLSFLLESPMLNPLQEILVVTAVCISLRYSNSLYSLQDSARVNDNSVSNKKV